MLLRLDPLDGEIPRACHLMLVASWPRSRSEFVSAAVYLVIFCGAYLLTPKTWLFTTYIGIVGGYFLIKGRQLELQSRIRRARARDKHALESYQIEVTAHGIRTWCDHIDTRYAWSGITRVIETPEFFLFLHGPNGGPVIPKRILDAALTSDLRSNIRDWSPDHGASVQAV